MNQEFPTPSATSFGALLKHHRTIYRTGLSIGETWTQQKLAERVGVSEETISLWERNKACPTEFNFKSLLEAFGLYPNTRKETRVLVEEFLYWHKILRQRLSEPHPSTDENERRRTRHVSLPFDSGKEKSSSPVVHTIPTSGFVHHPFHSLLRARLQHDFFRSSIDFMELLRHEHERSQAELHTLTLTPNARSRLDTFSDTLLSDAAFLGVPRKQLRADVIQLSNFLGRKIRIACPAVIAGAYAVSKFLERDFDISVNVDAATSSEQAAHLRKDASCDIVIAADGPMFTDMNENLQVFHRAFPVLRMTNVSLQKIGTKHGARTSNPKVYFYNGSASVLHLAVSRSSLFDVHIPSYPTHELSLPALLQAPWSLLNPGDVILVWSPIDDIFRRDPTMEILPHSRYDFTMSLFYNAELRRHLKGLHAIVDLWVATWKYLKHNIGEAEALLSNDEQFLESLYVGSGGVFLDSIL